MEEIRTKFLFLIITACIESIIAISYSEYYCSENSVLNLTYVSNVTDTCQSCREKCGAVQYVTQRFTNGYFICSCDALCFTYGDCCKDFEQTCPREYSRALQVMTHYGHLRHGMGTRCAEFENFSYHSPVINDCQYDRHACLTHRRQFDDIPVRDLDTGVDFINARCAVCNGVIHGEVWNTTMKCDYPPSREGDIVSPEDIIWALVNNKCPYVVEWPQTSDKVMRQCYPRLIKSCPTDCQNDLLNSLCVSGYTADITDGTNMYANVYCALCNSNRDVSLDDVHFRCGFEGGFVSSPGVYGPYDFSILFTFDSSSENGLALAESNPVCADGFHYVDSLRECKPILCPIFSRLVGNICVPLRKTTLSATIVFETLDTVYMSDINNSVDTIVNLTCLEITHYIQRWKLISDSDASCNKTFSKFSTTISYTEVIIYVHVGIYFSPDIDKDWVMDKLKNQIYQIIRNKTKIFDSLLQNNAIKNVTIIENLSQSVTDGLLPRCQLLAFNETEYLLMADKTVVIISLNQRIPAAKFILHNSILYVCKDVFESEGHSLPFFNNSNNTLGILSAVCMASSALCLLIRILLQCCVPVYQTFPMKLQCCFCIALLISVVLFLIAPVLQLNLTACTVTAIVLHYSLLATFFWMSLITMDMHRTFNWLRISQARPKHENFTNDITTYNIIAWVAPLPFVMVATSLDHVVWINDRYKANYGKEHCWMSTSGLGLLIYYAAPVFCIIAFNVVIFLHMSVNLKRAFSKRSQITSKTNLYISTYIRLFIMMGINYILVFLTPFVNHVALSVCIIAASASHGVYIFIAFVCTKSVASQVWHLICNVRNKIKHSSRKDTNSRALS